MWFLYQIGVRFYYWAIKIASVSNKQAKLWIEGRSKNAYTAGTKKQYIHFHCASLGEFEQARPLIDKLKQENEAILLTFFSPSGYEVRKNYAHADVVCYLPFEFRNDIDSFLNLYDIKFSVFVRYEFWLNFLGALKQRKIPVFLIAFNYKTNETFVKNYLRTSALNMFNQVFCNNETSVEQLQKNGFTHAHFSGDPRIDRVWEIAQNRTKNEVIEQFIDKKRKTIVVGSSWQEDEELIRDWYTKNTENYRLIIAPHHIEQERISNVKMCFTNSCCYSEYKKDNESQPIDVLIIDNFGMLAMLYCYADIAYVGGGFGRSVHNVLEATVYGKPVLFGPNYQKQQECIDLIALNAAFCVTSSDAMEKRIIALKQENFYQQVSAANLKYIDDYRGAVERILQIIQQS